MKKWIGLKLINFGIWLYDYNSHLDWDQEDRELYKRLHELKRKFEKQ